MADRPPPTPAMIAAAETASQAARTLIAYRQSVRQQEGGQSPASGAPTAEDASAAGRTMYAYRQFMAEQTAVSATEAAAPASVSSAPIASAPSATNSMQDVGKFFAGAVAGMRQGGIDSLWERVRTGQPMPVRGALEDKIASEAAAGRVNSREDVARIFAAYDQFLRQQSQASSAATAAAPENIPAPTPPAPPESPAPEPFLLTGRAGARPPGWVDPRKAAEAAAPESAPPLAPILPPEQSSAEGEPGAQPAPAPFLMTGRAGQRPGDPAIPPAVQTPAEQAAAAARMRIWQRQTYGDLGSTGAVVNVDEQISARRAAVEAAGPREPSPSAEPPLIEAPPLAPILPDAIPVSAAEGAAAGNISEILDALPDPSEELGNLDEHVQAIHETMKAANMERWQRLRDEARERKQQEREEARDEKSQSTLMGQLPDAMQGAIKVLDFFGAGVGGMIARAESAYQLFQSVTGVSERKEQQQERAKIRKELDREFPGVPPTAAEMAEEETAEAQSPSGGLASLFSRVRTLFGSKPPGAAQAAEAAGAETGAVGATGAAEAAGAAAGTAGAAEGGAAALGGTAVAGAEAGAAGGPVGMAIGAAAAVTVAAIYETGKALIELPGKLRDFGEGVLASNRYLQDYNATIAMAFAQTELADIRRAWRVGQGTEGTTAQLADSMIGLKDALVPQTQGFANFNNGLAALGARLGDLLAHLTGPLFDALGTLGKLMAVLAQALGENMGTLESFSSGFLTAMVPGLKELIGTLGSLDRALDEILGATRSVNTPFANFIGDAARLLPPERGFRPPRTP